MGLDSFRTEKNQLGLFHNSLLLTGNVFPAYRDVDLSQLHSSVGIGLRLGLTRSVNMIVNHINLSWPLDENLPGPVLSIQSKTSI